MRNLREQKKRRVRAFFALLLAPLCFLLLFEGFLRLGMTLGWNFVCQADLYADWTSDDDYWKLRQQWGKNVLVDSPLLFDPFLGWTKPKTQKNPLGAVTDAAYTPNYTKPTILFVGDSFVEGVTVMKDRIPQKLAELSGMPVYNFGMSGYGLDQIFLRWQQVAFPFQKPTALVGMATVDLDRNILGFRTGPKPRFGETGEGIALRGVPMPRDPRRWLKEYPPSIDSYAIALIERRLRLWHGGNPLEVMYLREPKISISTKILHRFAAEAKQREMPLHFVIFYNKEELGYEGWREKFLKEELAREKIPYLDTKAVLLRSAQIKKVNPRSFYSADGHLNVQGNELVASALNRVLQADFRP